jgi:hypothetical protein
MGGVVYRGTGFPQEYRNNYYFGDQRELWIRRLRLDASGGVIDMQPFDPSDGSVGDSNVGPVVDIEEGPDGALYYINLNAGVRKYTYTGNTLELSASLLLEGPYAGAGQMTNHLDLPSAPPFLNPEYAGTLLELDDAYFVESVPAVAVDYLVVSLRTGTDPTSEVAGSRLPGFLDTSGQLTNLDGSTPFRFAGIGDGSYYVVIALNNHLAVMSDTMVVFAAGEGAHDFTTGSAYPGDGTGLKALGAGEWGAFAGNAVPDTDIQALDFNAYINQTTAGATGYATADFNLDGAVQALDFNLYIANTLLGASSQVP